MADSISLPKFVSSARQYVQREVEQANADGNRTLTRAEARSLPVDLQDNFESFRQRGTRNGVANAAATTARADADGDGLLTTDEALQLPRDLQDNVVNFGNLKSTRALSAEQLQGAAASFIRENSGGTRWDDVQAALYPGTETGNNGTFGYLLSGEQAQTVVSLANAMKSPRDSALTFDPAAHNLVVVRDSEDEIGFHVAVQDKATGEVTPWGEASGPLKIDEISYSLDEAALGELFPETAGEPYPDPWEYLVTNVFEQAPALDLGTP